MKKTKKLNSAKIEELADQDDNIDSKNNKSTSTSPSSNRNKKETNVKLRKNKDRAYSSGGEIEDNEHEVDSNNHKEDINDEDDDEHHHHKNHHHDGDDEHHGHSHVPTFFSIPYILKKAGEIASNNREFLIYIWANLIWLIFTLGVFIVLDIPKMIQQVDLRREVLFVWCTLTMIPNIIIFFFDDTDYKTLEKLESEKQERKKKRDDERKEKKKAKIKEKLNKYTPTQRLLLNTAVYLCLLLLVVLLAWQTYRWYLKTQQNIEERIKGHHIQTGDTQLSEMVSVKKQKKSQENIGSKLALVMKSGKSQLGYKSTLKTLRNGKAKLVLISNNCPALRRSEIEYYAYLSKTKFHLFNGNNIDLGTGCGKHFRVSVMSITDAGDSDILTALGAK
eukprot:gene9161-11227_t